jgi:hypothetical protein
VTPRHSTGEQSPVVPRRGAGERSAGVAPIRRGTDEQLVVVPPLRGSGEQPAGSPRRGTDPADAAPGGRLQLRQARQLRLVTLAAVAIVLLAALPAIFLARDATRDPVFASLDSLRLPGWAAQGHEDAATGNRWCVETCRLRERTWRSTKPAKDTAPAYQQALADAGWFPWTTAGCPKVATGVYTCWQRDEFALDLWVRDAPCDLSAVVAPSAGAGGSPSAAPIPTPTGSEPPPTCAGSLVTAKAADRVDPHWHS